jgi:hypothetical protein
MPTTTTNYGRQNISWPDLGYDSGAGLHASIVGSLATLSNQISRYWSGSQALVAAESANLIHNFNLPLSQLRVRIFEANAELSDALDIGFTLATVSNSTISITNTGLVTRTIEVYIEPRTRMRGEDMDPAIAISTTGNATFNDVIVSGDLTVNGTTTTINSTTLEVADKNILVNNGGTDGTAEGSGLDVEGTGNTVVGSLKYEAALASKWKVGATGTEKQIVTVSDTQVITEKDIDGGVASNARRITLPSNTKSNLDGLTRKEGTIVYATDDDSIYVDDGTTLNAVGGTSNSVVVTQAAHGFVVGDVLYLNGSVYTKARADSANTSSVAGIVSRIQSVNVFQLTSGGKMSGLTGLTVGADYFLSPVTSGLLTVTEPTTTGHVSQPVGIALSATELQVAIKRGVVIGTSNVFTSISLANTSATTIQNIANFANGEGGVLTGVLKIDATTDYVFGFEISFTKDIAGVINHSVRYFAGDVLPGIVVSVSGQNIQVTLGTLAGFVSATARFQLSASAVSPSLQISSNNITYQEATAFRNRIINGDMKVSQRYDNAAPHPITAASIFYTVDRFFVFATGANVTGQRIVGSGSYPYVYRVTGAASNTQCLLFQRIEALNIEDLAGKNVSLQFEASATGITSLDYDIRFATVRDNHNTTTSIASGTVTVSSIPTIFTVSVTLPAGAANGVAIILGKTSGLVASQTFSIGGVQLERGSSATPFEVRPYGTELALCQRYFQKTYNIDVAPGTATGVGVIQVNAQGPCNYLCLQWNFPVSMRATPSPVTIYNPSTGGTGTIRSDAANIAAGPAATGQSGVSIQVSNVLTGVNTFNTAHATASAEL